MPLKLNGTNSVAAPAYAGDDADTGLQCGTNELKLVTGGTEAITVDSSQQVGIGTTAPGGPLEVQTAAGERIIFDSAGASQQPRIQLIRDGGADFDISNELGVYKIHKNDDEIYRYASDAHIFSSAGTERARIDSSGNLGLGENSPTNKLHIGTSSVMSASNGSTPGILLQQTGGTTGSGNYGPGICFSKINSGRPGGVISSIQTSTDDDRLGLSFFTHSSNSSTNAVTEQFRIRHDGELFGTDTSIAQLSDQRLKENIGAFTYSLDAFKLLQPKVFDWKNPELHGDRQQQRGFVAQDIEPVDSYWLDEIQVNAENADAQYLDEDRIAKTSKLGQKDAMYVSVIQQLLSKVETLEAKVAALEAAS